MATYHPLIGIFVDGVSSFGCGVLRGVTTYANLQRRWRLHMELWPADARLEGLPQCDGAIIAGQSRQVVDWAKSHIKHVILCSGSGDPARTPLVSVDNQAVGAMAADHLLACQLERFAYFGGTHFDTAKDRVCGFQRRLAEHGHSCITSPPSLTAQADRQLHSHQRQIIRWLTGLPKPIGILAFDDATALTLATACLDANIGVPDRVAILGVNDDAKLCDSAWPPLSSIDCGWARVGYEAAVLLEQMLSGQALAERQRHVRIPPVGIVARQSTNLLAVKDRDVAEAIRYIREHACDPCSIGDVLRHVPVGRRWLERQFASTLGRTPGEEIIRVRIETAQRYLAKTDMGLSDIAFRCGYSKCSHFHAAFKRVSGETPAAYRRRTWPQSGKPGHIAPQV